MEAGVTLSVVIPHFEDLQRLERCLKSLESESEFIDEVVVVDDNSRSLPKLKESDREYALRLVRCSKNSGGPAIPRNRGISEASSSHIILLDSDDMIFPGLLEKYKAIWEIDREVVLYGDHLVWGRDIKMPYRQAAMETGERVFERLLMDGNKINLSGSGASRNLLKRYEFEDGVVWEDFDLWIRLARGGVPFRKVDGYSAVYELKRRSRSSSRHSRRRGVVQISEKYLEGVPQIRRPCWYWRNRLM